MCTILQRLLLLVTMIAGVLVHKDGHLFFGWLFGAKTYVYNWWPDDTTLTIAGRTFAPTAQVDY